MVSDKMAIPIDKFPLVRCLSYQEVRKTIQSGDIILCSGESSFSNLIKYFTQSIWSHVGFILRFDELDRVMIMESVETKGVQIVPLSHYINNYNGKGKPYKGKILIARHSDINEANIKNLSKYAFDLLGHQYDKSEILRIASRIALTFRKSEVCLPPPKDNEYICSEYVYECYQSIGLHVNHNCGGFITPADFASTEKINAICLLKTI